MTQRRCSPSRAARRSERVPGDARCRRWRAVRVAACGASRSGPDLVGILLPFFFDADDRASSTTAIDQTLAYIIMALGLNIVVGFAGLLDLGYVAFFAIGAFAMGWLGSQRSSTDGGKHPHPRRRRIGLGRTCRASTSTSSSSFIAAALRAICGRHPRRPDAAPARRLPGDRDAGLRRDRRTRRRQRDSTSGIFGIGSIDCSTGRQGITPIDKVNLPWIGEKFNSARSSDRCTASSLAMVLLVMFFNSRLRDSRLGRAWIAVREDEVAAAAMGVNLVRTKLLAYALGAALGGIRGRVPGHLQQHGQRRPVRVRLLGLRPGDGHRRRHGQHLGRHPRRDRCCRMINRYLLPHVSTACPTSSGWTST